MEHMSSIIRPFGMRDKIGYALGDFSCTVSFSFTTNYAMLFFVTCMGVKPEHFAAIIMFIKVWDALTTPVIGHLSDRRAPGKTGKFKPWIKWGSIPLLVTSAAMFLYVPNAPYAVKITLFTSMYMIWSVAFASVNVPYGSMNSLITQDPVQRAELSTFRSIGAMAADAPVMVLVPLLIYDSNDNPKGGSFFPVILVMSLAGFAAIQLLGALVTERVQVKQSARRSSDYLKTLKDFFKNRSMMGLTISSMSYLAFIGTTLWAMQYLFMCYFRNAKLLSLGMIIGGFPVLFALLASKPLVKKYGKKTAVTYPFLLGIAASGIMTFVKIKNPYVWLALLGVVMLSSGMHMILTWALAADCIDYQQLITGRSEEGSIFGTFSLFRKLSQGIGGAAVALALKWARYAAENGADQLSGVAERIRFATGLIPLTGCIICFLSMALLYNINETQLTRKEPSEIPASSLDEHNESHKRL
ncbi:MAG TPA: glycoside-pentoside-hexuronide (GPH):cation symporter [Clostridiales bacterium]|nr:glycoside-pentoside-hexuronide (GPH):cation symporter [Clostridiales bacterium]HQK72830.1 glycoside-pentoside-hexuronide (GPH):cation symporter [Clostridiales bacterium]